VSTELLRARARQAVELAGPRRLGRVRRVVGLNFEVDGVEAAIGDAVEVQTTVGRLVGEVVALSGSSLVCMPLGQLRGLRAGDWCEPTGRALTVPVGEALLGRVLDGLGNPIDGLGPLTTAPRATVEGEPPHPLTRSRIELPLHMGVRSLDTLVPCGRGQRLGIFAGSGVGKSTLLSMIARGSEADVNVIALIGERGREVREFIENDLGPEGLARSVVVVATSDQPALIRIKAAFAATRIAEWFRDRGDHVVLMMDSITRFCMAQREVGLSAGEPPATRGYPPSVFAMLPRLLERAGSSDVGSITGLYTVLVEGDDMNEPIGDASRSILDGHVVLSRSLASQGHYPAIEVLESLSRVMPAITTQEQRAVATEFRRLLAAYREAKDLIEIGAYVPGTNPLVDRAIERRGAMDKFLCQTIEEHSDGEDNWRTMASICGIGYVG